jgi:hypothetical protein
VRICGDYKLTVNKVAEPDTYPILKMEDRFAALEGGQTFSKAYQQIELDEESKELATINTHKGLCRFFIEDIDNIQCREIPLPPLSPTNPPPSLSLLCLGSATTHSCELRTSFVDLLIRIVMGQHTR